MGHFNLSYSHWHLNTLQHDFQDNWSSQAFPWPLDCNNVRKNQIPKQADRSHWPAPGGHSTGLAKHRAGGPAQELPGFY